jgi:hypothetical protein
MPEPPLDPELAALSAALGALPPAPPALDRDRLFFEAGRRAARPRPWAWPLAACTFAALSAGLSVRLAVPPEPAPEVRVIYVSAPTSGADAPDTPSPPAPARADLLAFEPRTADAPYLRLRDQVARFGADALPRSPAAAPTPHAPIERMLGLPFGSLDDTLKARWKSQLSQGDV